MMTKMTRFALFFFSLHLATVLSIVLDGDSKAMLFTNSEKTSSGTCAPRETYFSKTRVISGPGGTPFDDINLLHLDETVTQIKLAVSNRVYGMSFTTQYRVYEHANTGYNKEAYIDASNKVTEIFVCQEGIKSQVIQYIKFSSAAGVIIAGGSITRFSRPCQTIHIPAGKELVGMYGREGGAIGGIGFILKPVICIKS